MSMIGESDAVGDHADATDRLANLVLLPRAVSADRDRNHRFGCRNWTDQQLMLAAPNARDAAFAELFRRHSASVAAVATMVLGAASSASDDVVAEVFAALWTTPDKFDPARGSLLGFLRLRARGRSLDLLRSEASRRQRERNDDRTECFRSAIDAQLLSKETADALRNAVSRLPEIERKPLELAYFEGMTYRAVARRCGLPEGTIKSRIRSGLQHLRILGDGKYGRDGGIG